MLIWVVDDDKDIRSIVVQVLEGAGHAIQAFGSGAEALKGDITDVQLLVTDFRLQDMNGVELLGKLRKKKSTLAALFVTGEFPATLGDLPEQTSILEKPFSLSSLRAAVKKIAMSAQD